MCEMLDIIEKEGERRGEKRGEKRGKKRGEKRGIRNGILISLKNLMETMEVNIDRAMDILKIPSEERNMYRGLINGKITK